METMRSADREAKRRFWEQHLNQWESSAISQNAYCRQNHLSLHGFIYWKKKRASPNSTISLVEWPVPRSETISLSSLGPTLCVVIGAPHRIEILSGFDPAMLDSVVRVLRGL
jgi:hypothetical protein